MKRKIALLMAFVMILTMVPMSVSAARLGGGAIPTLAIPDGGTVSVNAGHAALRSIVLDANVFPVGVNNIGNFQAVVTVDGLEDGQIDRYTGLSLVGVGHGRVSATSGAALGIPLLGSAASFTTEFNLNENSRILSAGTAIAGDAYMVVVMIRDGDDRAILYIQVNSGGAVIPSGFGASVPVAYTIDDFDGENVVADFTWPFGLGGLPSSLTLLQVHSDDFEFGLADDPTTFNTRTRIPAIEIREPAGLGFNSNAGWNVVMTLERGFAWDRRHDGNDEIYIGTDLGGALGLNVAAGSTSMNTSLAEVNRERNRELTIGQWNAAGNPTGGIEFTNATTAGRFRDTLLIGDEDDGDGALWITAGDNARVGPVRAYVELIGPGSDVESSGWVTVAYFSHARIYFHRCEDADLDDYTLPSGRMEWNMGGNAADYPWDAVEADSPIEDYHQTAWVVLTESVRGVLPFTGLRDISFEFPEGAQVLGVRWETNDGNFIDEQNDDDGDAWFYNGRTRDGGSMDILITRNRVQMRPEIGREEGREEVAELRLQFYVSIEPEFEALYGDALYVYAFGPGFEDGYRAQVAIIHDPITVESNRVNVGDGDIVAAGMFRHIEIDPVYVHETDIGALEWDLDVALFVEENTFIDTVAANAIILRAGTVETDGVSGLEVSRPINNGRGTLVTITRTSVNEPGWIRFSDIQITGLVLPGHEYDVTVVGDAVAGNYHLFAGGWGGIGNIAHGFWTDEPYRSEAFGFDGTDALAPPAPVAPPELPPVVSAQPRTLFQNQPFTIQSGPQAGMTIFPSFEMIAFGGGDYASAFIAAAAIGDVLGWENSWDPATSTGTFFLPDGRVVAFTNGTNAVNVNGVQQFMTNADGSPANARIINDRFMIHIRFFEQLGVNITWLGGTPGNNSLIVTP